MNKTKWFICPDCNDIIKIEDPLYGTDFECPNCESSFPLIKDEAFDTKTDAIEEINTL